MFASQQPLPSGWEAKWDTNYKRYYFINHVSKETTWIDPRSVQSFPLQQTGPRPVQQTQQTAPAPMPTPQATLQNPSAAKAQPASVALPEKSSPAVATTIPQVVNIPLQNSSTTQVSSSSTSGDRTGVNVFTDVQISEKDKQTVIQTLRREFDLEGVGDYILETALSAAGYDLEMAKLMCVGMGFQRKGSGPPAVGVSSTPSWQAGSPSATPAAAPPKAEASASTAGDGSRANASMASSLVMSSAPAYEPLSFDPVAAGTDSANLQADEAARSSVFRSFLSATKTGSSLDAMFAKSTAATTQFKSATSSAARPEVSKASLPAARTEAGTQKIAAVGPNQALARGPDLSLIRVQAVKASGADLSLCRGPQQQLAKGAASVFVDRVYSQGADRSLCRGSDPALCKGPRLVAVD